VFLTIIYRYKSFLFNRGVYTPSVNISYNLIKILYLYIRNQELCHNMLFELCLINVLSLDFWFSNRLYDKIILKFLKYGSE